MGQPLPTRSVISQILTALGKEHPVLIPTINKGVGEIEELIALRNGVPWGANVVFDFRECGQLSLNAAAFLGGLVALARQSGGSAKIRADTIKPKLRQRMADYGLLDYLGVESSKANVGAIPFGHHQDMDKSRIMRFLEQSWLGVGAVRLSKDLQAAIMGNAWEVYANAFEHSGSPIGLVNCGAYDKTHRRLQLSVMDFGIGIPENVRRYRPGLPIDARRAMKWAFADGTSTKAEEVGYSRGLGLHTLKEFIKVNEGFMEVFSNDGYVKITKRGETYSRRSSDFQGTLVHISLSADARFYYFAYEAEKYEHSKK